MAMGGQRSGTEESEELASAWFAYECLSKVVTDHAFTYRHSLKRNPHLTLKVLNIRIDYLMASLAETLGLKEPFPSAPKRWGKYCLWAEHKGRLMIRSFCEAYAAKAYLDCLMPEDVKMNWISNKEISTSNGLILKSDYLEELVEYEPTKKEQQWKLPENYVKECAAFLRGEKVTMSDGNNEKPQVKAKRPDAEPKPERVKKERAPRPDGLIALQDICEELKMEPKEARVILRAKKVEKPAHGRWEWPQDEVESIKKVIKAGAKAK